MLGKVSIFLFFTVLLAMVMNCATQSATKDNVPTSDNLPGTEQYVAPTPDVPVRDVAPDFTFAIWDTNGKICLLAKFSASFQITYESTGGDQTVSVNLPEEAQVNGRCASYEKEPQLELQWPGFRLIMEFTLAKPTESWELLAMELLYNTASPIFDEATNAGKRTARSLEDGLFATPYGKSYFCPSPDVINMYNSKKDKIVLARLKDVRLQVYDVEHGKFSTAQRCSLVRIGGIPEPFAQDETVPIAVGSTLAVVSVLVVIGYALWRNMATRKADYDTME